MGSLNTPITNRRRSITKRRRSSPFHDRNGNLTPLHYQILQWVEDRRPGDTRPHFDGLSGFVVDSAIAELVLLDLVKAISIPQSRYNRAHWTPTGLTGRGWRTMLRRRRTRPRPVTHPWWPLRTWG